MSKPSEVIALENILNFELTKSNYHFDEGKQAVTSLTITYKSLENISFITTFSSLERLDLSNNKIVDIASISLLKKLTYLCLSHNEIKNITPLSSLINLKDAILNNNNISDVQPLALLKNLSILDLSDNKEISDISCFSQLTNLGRLDLTDNKINDVSNLTSLTHLQSLFLDSNLIDDISFLPQLYSLRELTIDKKAYSSLKPFASLIDKKAIPISRKLMEKGEKVKIQVIDNGTIFPPMPITMQGEQAIIAYYNSLKLGSQPLNEVKVLLVGDGAAGKTSLVKAVIGKAFNAKEKQTHGIQIQDENILYENEDIKVHYWDFGGQEIMHATHQFFLTKESVYVLVLDGRRDERPEYWLKHITTFGGDAPIIIVLNKCEDNRSYDLVKQDLLKKYPSIQGFFNVSCLEGIGIKEFKEVLHKQIFDLDFRKTPFSPYWKGVKDYLRVMEEPYISYEKYYSICEDFKITDEDQQKTLLEYLNSLGVILHFEALKNYNTQVLNPLWLTQAVYRIINSPIVAAQGGKFEEQDLYKILNDDHFVDESMDENTNLVQKLLRWFSLDEKEKKKKIHYENKKETLSFIAKVMQQFELSFCIDETTHIVPDLLPVEPKENISLEEFDLHFATEFYFLPPALLPRFIVQTHENIKDGICWRSGVILDAKMVYKASAVVQIDKENKRLHIYLKGEQKKELLAYIRSVLHSIYETYEGFKQSGKIIEFLFLPDRPDIEVPYTEIEGLEKMNEEFYTSGKAGKKYSIKQLMGSIENPEYHFEDSTSKTKIFISYSRKNKKYREELVTMLHPLVRSKDNYLELWYDQQDIEPGEEWMKEIEKAIAVSDIIVCLLTPEYLSSFNCMMEAHKGFEGEKTIYAVLVNECGWKETIFEKINGFYEVPLATLSRSNRPAKWMIIYNSIHRLVKKIKTK